jgi:hypothetical protein
MMMMMMMMMTMVISVFYNVLEIISRDGAAG